MKLENKRQQRLGGTPALGKKVEPELNTVNQFSA
jgi:hypothetical protein